MTYPRLFLIPIMVAGWLLLAASTIETPRWFHENRVGSAGEWFAGMVGALVVIWALWEPARTRAADAERDRRERLGPGGNQDRLGELGRLGVGEDLVQVQIEYALSGGCFVLDVADRSTPTCVPPGEVGFEVDVFGEPNAVLQRWSLGGRSIGRILVAWPLAVTFTGHRPRAAGKTRCGS